MAQITTNQHSYSNAYALLNVAATAVRSGVNAVDITASWKIETAGSSLASASRYLVLMVGSESGTKYFSTEIRSVWASNTTYEGSYTFKNVTLDSASTSIKIGFGVSASSSSLSTSGTLVWNGSSSVASSTHDPDIQWGTITGIAKGYTACTAPKTFTASPTVWEKDITLSWSGASGGTNNAITGYETQYEESEDGVKWGGWAYRATDTTSPAYSVPGTARGHYIKYRIRTLGSAGSAYYSEWKESNIVKKAEPRAYINNGTEPVPHGVYIHNGTEYVRHYPYIHDGTKWVPCSE